ncbi:TPA: imidazoleglycerol-phosphate dehydratase HisB [bacterium]|nr:imidazoleglycerol-phosphate dehydratase HisB [bacterium]
MQLSLTREASAIRTTKETDVRVRLNIDGSGNTSIDTGIGFFNHLLTSFAFHGRFDLDITARGDLDVDGHHLCEDTGIVLGDVFNKALGDLKIVRFGYSIIPMDDALIISSVDVSGRPYFETDSLFKDSFIGTFQTEWLIEFLRAFSINSRMTLHVVKLRGDNSHHIAECTMKSIAISLREAVKRTEEVLSTKGVL